MGLKSITLEPGQCFVLPKDAVVQSIVTDGAITVTSDCGALPTPSTYKCGYFYLILDSDDNDGHSMNEEDTRYVSIKVGSNIFTINELVVTGDNPGTLVPIGTLNLHITDLPLFQFTSIVRNTSPVKRQLINVFFKTPEPLFDTLELKVDNRGSIQYYRPIEGTCGDYPMPS